MFGPQSSAGHECEECYVDILLDFVSKVELFITFKAVKSTVKRHTFVHK